MNQGHKIVPTSPCAHTQCQSPGSFGTRDFGANTQALRSRCSELPGPRASVHAACGEDWGPSPSETCDLLGGRGLQTQSILVNQSQIRGGSSALGGVGLPRFWLQCSPRWLHRCFKPVRLGKVRTLIRLLPKRPRPPPSLGQLPVTGKFFLWV